MILPGGYEIAVETPAIDDYLRLRRIAGLSPKTEQGARAGLPTVSVASSRAMAAKRSAWDG